MNAVFKHILKVVAMAVCLFSTCHATEEAQKAKTSYLFVMHAAEARILPNKSTPTEGTLTLDNIDPNVVFFSDRPTRHAGKIPTAQLLADWDEGHKNFKKDAPNAALVMNNSTKNQQFTDEPVILSKPVWSPNGGKSLTFEIKSLTGKPLKNGTASEVYLFIDNIGITIPAGPGAVPHFTYNSEGHIYIPNGP